MVEAKNKFWDSSVYKSILELKKWNNFFRIVFRLKTNKKDNAMGNTSILRKEEKTSEQLIITGKK